MWPPTFWKKYEYFIRQAAGLGQSPKTDDPHQYEHFHYHCDLLVVGGGVSGLFAAEIASEKNLKVLLVEQEADLGGALLAEQDTTKKINELSVNEWKDNIVNVLRNKNNLKIGALLSLILDKIFFIISIDINSENKYKLTKFAPYLKS